MPDTGVTTIHIETLEFQPLPNGERLQVIGTFRYEANNERCIDLNYPDMENPEFADISELLEYISKNIRTITLFTQSAEGQSC